jgi:hypothetical protein
MDLEVKGVLAFYVKNFIINIVNPLIEQLMQPIDIPFEELLIDYGLSDYI